MKCVLVLVTAVLFFCSFCICATLEDVQKNDFLGSLMCIAKQQEKQVSIEKPKAFTGPVTGTFTGSSITGSVTGDVTGSATDTSGSTVTLTGTVTCTGTAAADPGGAVNCNVAGSGSNILTGSLKGKLTGNGDVSTATYTLSCTGSSTGTLTCSATPSGAGSTTGVSFTGSLTSTSVAVGKGGVVGPSGSGTEDNSKGKEDLPTTTTTTEAPEITTTSTATPTDAPQQATEKPTNPTEGKTDSSNSHVASYVTVFIGTIALLSVV